jgi:hypothetical protein
MQWVCGIDVSKVGHHGLPEQQCFSVRNAAGWAGRPLDLGDRSHPGTASRNGTCRSNPFMAGGAPSAVAV